MYEVFSRLLKERNETAYQVAKATGVATATLTAWKNGQYEPKLDKLMLIAEHLEVPIDVFLDAKRQTENLTDCQKS